MVKLDEIFQGDHLKASDLRGNAVKVVISGYEVVEFDDGAKPVLSFKGKNKTLVCNKTNSNTIATIYGDELDEWAGKEITLIPAQVDFQGKQVACIRVKLQMPVEPEPASDEVPF